MLEREGVLIPWGARIADLVHLASATVEERDDSVHLTWRDRLCLGGLQCSVSAIRLFESPNYQYWTSSYHLFLKEFHHASLEIQYRDDVHFATEFRRIFAHLELELGVPTCSYPKYESELPAICWEYPGLAITYLPLGGCRLGIQHEPDGYDELKKANQRTHPRQGKGLRVDYVAW